MILKVLFIVIIIDSAVSWLKWDSYVLHGSLYTSVALSKNIYTIRVY